MDTILNIPPKRVIRFVEEGHRHMKAAGTRADFEPGKSGAVIVKDENILGEAWGDDSRDCISEAVILATQYEEANGASIYVWGLWQLTKESWDALREARIDDVALLEDCERLFNTKHPEYQRPAI